MKTTLQERTEWRGIISKWEKLGIQPDTMKAFSKCLDDIDTLKAALEQVEWIPFYTSLSGIRVRCPWCGLLEVAGHGPFCPRQLALKEGE